MSHPELDRELATIRTIGPTVPLYFDVKGRQLRVTEVLENPDYLDVRLNHPIHVPTPTVVLLKAGADAARLGEVSEGGYRLTFDRNPRWGVRPGESLHIRDRRLEVGGPLFTDAEVAKIRKVVESGLISRWFISYVEEATDLKVFREIVGDTVEVMLKIESKRGLEYVATGFSKQDGVRLVAACGDLYVEVDRPHQILRAVESIIAADPEACAGSRLLLSTVRGPSTYLRTQVTRLAEQHSAACADILDVLQESHEPKVPDFADFAQLAWLHKIGFRSALLCDEICLKSDLLSNAVNAFEAFRTEYCG
jgi:hypothetical protein